MTLAPRPKARPELLAPAGDRTSLEAAVAAGADAVYLGLTAWSARARAENFDEDEALASAMEHLHRHGRRGYVALNTLVFDAELEAVERSIRAAARAGVDALIVQDLGVARLARAIAPELPLHASTQMTCTDAGAVELARELGASRVILARELSRDDIAAIRHATDVELEVFVHGALCIAYSGQCLTSEALGGRSANRGACAQACRLPYELVVDGELRDTGERAFLLSPQDLEASELVPALAELGVASVKIEGRLKGAAYVAATTELYRAALDAWALEGPAPTREARERALVTYSRGSGSGFLEGVDHQRLVEGRACDHRGLLLGTLGATITTGGRAWLEVRTSREVARGDGVLVEGGLAGAGELGGRVWAIEVEGREVERAPAGSLARLWLGPERGHGELELARGRRVWKNDDPAVERAIVAKTREAPARTRLDLVLEGRVGAPAVLTGRTSDGRVARVTSDGPLDEARGAPTTAALLRDKLGRLGDTPFELGELEAALDGPVFVAPALQNRLRRALVEALDGSARRSWAATEASAREALARAAPPERPPPPRGLFVLCRSLEQARAAREAGADGVWLDLLELQGTGAALRALRAEGPGFVGVAPPRIRKPGEEKIDRYLASLEPDGVLVRGLGALFERSRAAPARDVGAPTVGSQTVGAQTVAAPLYVGDFSLNATNRLTASELLARGLDAFTPSFDLDAAQVTALLETPFGPFTELVVHHPMPLFHMEHCVIAAELSTGRDHRDCGRPCERHRVSLRDRVGMEHPVEAVVGCRNTVFHAASQSGASLVPGALASGVGRFRVELVREDQGAVARIVGAYRALLEGAMSPSEVFRSLGTEARYGVVRGSLRVLSVTRGA
jgi:putative protease